MKNTLKVFTVLVALFITSCSSSVNSVDTDIKDYLKSQANDPSSVELIETKLIRTETISTSYKELIDWYSKTDTDKLQVLESKEAELSSNETPVSYCYTAKVRSKNVLGQPVLQNVAILFDKDMNIITHGDGLMSLNLLQMEKLLLP